jgi:hypothetical protein
MVVFSIVMVLLLIGVLLLVPVGLRAGDRAGDALLLGVEPNLVPRGTKVTLINRGEVPVIVGMSLRRCGLRLHLEGGSYVRVRTRRTDPDLMPERQAALGVVAAGETDTFVVPADTHLGERA